MGIPNITNYKYIDSNQCTKVPADCPASAREFMKRSSLSYRGTETAGQSTQSGSPKESPDKINEFFTKHSTIRNLFVFSPLIIAGVVAVNKFGPYKLLPHGYRSTWTFAIAFAFYMGLFKHASYVDQSLQNKKIERLN